MAKFKNQELMLIEPDHCYADHLLEIILRNQADFKNWLPWANQKFNRKVMSKFIEYYINGHENNKEYRYFIYHIQEKAIIGSITLRNICLKDQSAELGFWLDKVHVGNGYIIKSFDLLYEKAISLNLNYIYAKTFDNNLKSIKTLNRLDFHQIYNSQSDALLFQRILH